MEWRHILLRTVAVIGVAFLLAVIAGFFIVKSPWFHQKVLSIVIEKGQATTGGKLEIANWDLRFHPLRVDLYNIALHGTEPAGTKPLLQADELTLGVNFDALLHRKLHLSEILIQHPVVRLRMNRNGQSNLPPRPPSKQSNITVWNLEVGHTLLTHGEIDYNDVQKPLEAELYGLETEIRFDRLATSYTGSLSYHTGRLQYANYPVVPHALHASFTATPSGLSLHPLFLKVGHSEISLRGELLDYQNPVIKAVYEGSIHTEDSAAFSPGISAAGDVRLSGGLQFHALPNHPLLETLLIDGNLASARLQGASSQGRVIVRNLRAHYRLANGNLEVRNLAGGVLGGELTADLTLRNLETTPAGSLHASIAKVSLTAAKNSVKKSEIRRLPVTGTVDAGVDGNWRGSIKKIQLRGNATLRAAIWNKSAAQPSATPIDGAIHLTYDGEHQDLALHQTTVRIPSASVTLDGRVGEHSNLQVHAIAGHLHQLTKLLASLRSGEAGSSVGELAISGSAKLDAIVQGSIRKPGVSGHVSAENLQVQGSQWSRASLTLQASPSQLTISQGSLVSAKQGELSFSADVKLKNWAYQSSNQIRANVDARNLSILDLEHLANRQYPISGTLSVNAILQGSELNPSGHGSARIVRASAYDQPIQSLTAQFQTANDSIQSTLNFVLPAAGSTSADLTYTPKTKAYKLDLHAPAIALQKLQFVQMKNLPLSGTLSASAQGAGTLDRPQLDLQVQIPELSVRQTNITQINAHVNIANQQANLTLTSNIYPAYIRAHAAVSLTGNYEMQASLDTNRVPLDPFLAVYAPSVPAGFHGESELHASLQGPLKDQSRLVAHVTIPVLGGSYQTLQFAAVHPIRIDYSNGLAVLAPAEIRGTDTSVHLEARVPVRGNGNMNLQAEGGVNLALLGMFSSDLKSAGGIQFDIHGGGSVHQPSMSGNIQIKDAAFSTSGAPIGLSKVNGTLDLTPDRVQIATLSGEFGGGKVTAGGSILYRPNLQFGLALDGKALRLLYPQGVRTTLDTHLTFTGNLQAARVRGLALVDSLNFTPDFDLTSVASQFGAPSVPPLGQTFADNVSLAVAVQSAQTLSARSQQLNLAGTANLQIVGTAANPVITGRVDLTSGELFFMNNRYQLQRGIVTFDNPNQTNPVLNVQVTSLIEQYNLTLTLRGPLNRLTTNYVSDPSLPTADIISLVYRGQTTEEAASAGTSTDALLAGQAASRFSSGLQQLAGISSLQIDPLLGGNNTNPSARIAIQQRVTSDFLFTFSTDVTQPEQEIVQGEYQINKRWSVSVERDQVGGYAVDGRLHTRF